MTVFGHTENNITEEFHERNHVIGKADNIWKVKLMTFDNISNINSKWCRKIFGILLSNRFCF